MTFDPVHDTAAIFRTLTHAYSFPGTRHSLSAPLAKMTLDSDCPHTFLILALTLIDNEVRFAYSGNAAQSKSHFIASLTFSQISSIESGQYIFVEDNLADTLERCAIGDLAQPHTAATVITLVKSFESGQRLQFSGPGIQKSFTQAIDLPSDWITVRAERNREFPLGVDLIFVDPDGSILAIPRTTHLQLIREEA
jgi:alpha-D-ribose 1-methylphosphonate 5-triphosphate synthase subunit PhnH